MKTHLTMGSHGHNLDAVLEVQGAEETSFLLSPTATTLAKEWKHLVLHLLGEGKSAAYLTLSALRWDIQSITRFCEARRGLEDQPHLPPL